MISDRTLERYSRQLLVPGFDFDALETLQASHVAIIGCGGLGVPIAMYLGAAGIGRLTLIDEDCVELSNLPRQTLFKELDIGQPKVSVVAQHLLANNPDLELQVYRQSLTPANAQALLEPVDAVVDATDNVAARLLIDRITYALGKPWFMGAAVRLSGQNIAFDVGREQGCYHCLIAPNSGVTEGCSELGVVGAVVAAVATQQVMDVLKMITGCGAVQWGQLRLQDFACNQSHNFVLQRRTNCPNCGIKSIS